MRPVPAAARAASALILLSLMAVGCSDPTPSGAPSVKPSAQGSTAPGEKAYYTCLKNHGIPLETTDNGSPRVVKGNDNNAAILAAEKACAELVPPLPPPPEEDVARARKLSACLREHGVKDYPDPGPDGDTPLTGEMAHAMKTNPEYRKANRTCDPRTSGGEDLSTGG